MPVEIERVRQLNKANLKPDRKYVLYWAQMNRRVDSNHALLYAVEIANSLKLPVLYYERLTCSYPYASDRLHTFILQGVPENAKRAKKAGLGYCFDLRKGHVDRDDTVFTLASDAAALITDDFPTFVTPQNNARIGQRLDIPYFVVDSSCIVPMSKFEKREYAAYTIRPKIHRFLPQCLKPADPLKVNRRFDGTLPGFHVEVTANNIRSLVAECEIDHAVKPCETVGGRLAAEKALDTFLEQNLRRYAKERNEPSAHATSGMSPYLHFGNISSLEIAMKVKAYAQEHHLIAEEYLEELIVRRELAFNYSRFVDNPESLDNLPDWVQQTMSKHAPDRREHVYKREQFERAETADALWNASQKELLLRGKIHGYYRMYWGKKIIEWSATYRDAAETMIYLHDRYALDGRDPNTYTNILWCFGLHDRPWGERPIFGSLRYMSLDGMKRKTRWQAYIDEIRLLEESGGNQHRIA
jgi:deoxyribodipyrimidine photo-lyase